MPAPVSGWRRTTAQSLVGAAFQEGASFGCGFTMRLPSFADRLGEVPLAVFRRADLSLDRIVPTLLMIVIVVMVIVRPF